MLVDKVLICKRSAVDRHETCSVVIHKVASLNHEILDDPVERAVLETERHAVLLVLAGAKLAKVLGRTGHRVRKELNLDSADFRGSDRDVEKDDRVLVLVRSG